MNKVTIDVEARFIDNVTDDAKAAAKSFTNLEKAAEEATKDVDKLGKANAKPKVTMDADRAAKKLDSLDKKLNKIGKTKAEAKLTLLDKASARVEKVLDKMKTLSSKTYNLVLKIRDSNVLSALNKMSNGIKGLTSKAWNVAVRIKDTFTAPLTKLKNMLFNVRTLIAGIASAWAATKLIANPIGLADAYSSAKIGFSTLLGESRGQQMMDELDQFAKVTPFKTSGVIANAQKMMAMGWDPENIIEDMEIIGNAAAATGKMDQGLESIVRAMSQIKTKGKLSTEELNQLAEAGIAAKQMLAENLGYGTGDAGIAAMTKDLEDGLIASDVAIQALLAGMRKYDGMMDSMANETVEGLISQMGDAFEINIVRKWGQGLQAGAKRGFGTFITLLDEAENAMAELGDMLYDVGETASNWVADKFQSAVEKVLAITDTFEFQNASLKEKFSMLWKGLIADPLHEFWTSEENIQKATEFGTTLAKGLTRGILAVLGITDVFDEAGLDESGGSNIAQGFAKGFVDGFDVSAITNKLADAIGNVWGALPTWAKLLIGGYGVGKAAGGLANFAGSAANFLGGAKNAIGGFKASIVPVGPAYVAGSGILGTIGKAGVGLGATTTGSALLMGGAGIAGGVAGGLSFGKGIFDLFGSYKAYRDGDEIEGNAKRASGFTAMAGVGAGAAIGSLIGGPVGTLVGAGIGGIVGWLGGDKWADNIRAAKYEAEGLAEEFKQAESEEELLAVRAKGMWENAKRHFGNIKLSVSEIQRLADQVVWGDDLANFDNLSAATKAAENSIQQFKSAAEQVNRWTWKASLGVKFNEDEKEAIVASFEDYINSAKAVVENKHYEFSAAVGLLVDITSETGASIINSGNSYYSGLEEQLDQLHTELQDALDQVLADGVISTDNKVKVKIGGVEVELNEQEAITQIQQKIAEIEEKVATAQAEAELEALKIKFGSGNLDYESFEGFMAEISSTLEERLTANDTALTASIASLKLQLADEAITEDDYNAQMQALVDGYTGKVESIKAEVMDVELSIIGDAYEDLLGDDAKTQLANGLQKAIREGLTSADVMELSGADLAKLISINPNALEGSGFSADNIQAMLSGVLSQIEQIQVDADLLATIGTVAVEGADAETIEGVVDEKFPDALHKDIRLDVKAKSQIMNKFEFTSKDFGVKSSYTFNPVITVNPSISTTSKNFRIEMYEGAGYRGGIFGGSFARGGIPGFNGMTDEGGIVGGSTRFIRVNEESPEMVIPLSSQRRGRALKLWAQAGNIMGVPGFARGGIVGGTGSDEGIRFQTYGSGNEPAGGRTVQVNMGGVTFEINVNGSDKEGIAEAIKAQAGDLADYFVGIIADALETEFENTPVRGGAT